ncbi:MAG: acyl-CoA carboxylase subunit epsilon [Acidobacteria bacterium]|nr:acyl-CoA carboxylase subunit epsilon [Acidobacteriota bacterium]
MTVLELRGEPSDEEVAAIMAASAEVFAPAPAPQRVTPSSRWRFSGRGWMQDRFYNRRTRNSFGEAS